MIKVASPVVGPEEIAAVVEVLKSRQLVQGKLVAQLEQRLADFLGVRHVVAVSSGTAALHVALLANGVGVGDEVITTPFSFIATANAILYTGAKPVFVDICEDTFNLDPSLVESALSKRTKAILPVHLYGCPAQMDQICDIARQHNLAIVEDAAQAIGASIAGRKVGTFGTACLSFYATKNITTAEGGAIATNDDQTAELSRILRNQGQRARYQHEILGYNYRLTDLQAAIGLAQMDRLETLTAKRIANADYLSKHLPADVIPTVPPGFRHVFHQYTVRVRKDRDRVAALFNEAGVGTAVHYPIPIHAQKLYEDLGYTGSLPVSEKASREVLSLPVHPSLTAEELAKVGSEGAKYLAL
jgi:perosamine synthetase